MKTVMNAEIGDKEKLFDDLTSSVESAFDSISSESKLVTLLHRTDLLDSIQRFDVAQNKRIDGTKFDEYADEDGNDVVIDTHIEKPKCTLVLMPIAHQIKQFFELPNVFAKIQAHTAAIEAQPKLSHFIKGT